MRLINKKGQNTAEYAILIALVIAAAIGVQTYVKRGWQGRVKDESDRIIQGVQGNFTGIVQDAAHPVWGTTKPVTPSQQFEPRDFSREAHSNTLEDSTSFNMAVGGTVTQGFKRETVPAKAGDKQGYGYNKQ